MSYKPDEIQFFKTSYGDAKSMQDFDNENLSFILGIREYEDILIFFCISDYFMQLEYVLEI